MIMRIIFSVSIFAISAQITPQECKWQVKSTHNRQEFIRSITGTGYHGNFQATLRLQIAPKWASFRLNIPNYKQFKMLDLDALTNVDGPMPGKGAMIISNPALKVNFKLDIQGIISENDDNEDTKYDLVWVGNKNSNDNLCQNILYHIKIKPEGWIIKINHKNKNIILYTDFPPL